MKNNNKAKSTVAIPLEHSIEMRFAYQVAGLRGKKLTNLFKQYARATVFKHCKKPIGGTIAHDKRKENKGRPPKLGEIDSRQVVRQILHLRNTIVSFTSRKVQIEAGLTHVSNRTVRRIMNRNGYHYCRSRKKGLLRKSDLVKRLQYCRQVKRDNLGQDYWNYGISFYFDGDGFIYKTNPLDQALAPKACEWRKFNEGLAFGCTAKGRKEGETQAKFMVAILYNRGVVMCEQYTKISGEKFAKMVDRHFPQAFALSINPHDQKFLQDGDPSQNSACAMEILENIGATVVKIPARSPDLNPIENFFNLVDRAIFEDTIQKNITSETFTEFSTRIRDIIVNYPRTVIDKIIQSMDKRISMVIKVKGNRIKY